MPLVGSKETIFTFKLQGVGKVFQIGYTDVNPKVAMMRVGDKVDLTYYETTETAVTIKTFDIPAIGLEKGSVDQARYLDNQKVVDMETARVDKQQQLDDLKNSDQMQNVDPVELQKFLAEQAKKKQK